MRLEKHNVVIANGASLSGDADLREKVLVAIEMPSAWTAADLSFQSTVDNDPSGGTPATYSDVYDSNDAELVVQAAAARYIVFTSAHRDALFGVSRLKVRSGVTGTPVAQGAARTIKLIVAVRD